MKILDEIIKIIETLTKILFSLIKTVTCRWLKNIFKINFQKLIDCQFLVLNVTFNFTILYVKVKKNSYKNRKLWFFCVSTKDILLWLHWYISCQGSASNLFKSQKFSLIQGVPWRRVIILWFVSVAELMLQIIWRKYRKTVNL